LLNTFVAVATEDFKPLNNIVDNPRLPDKLVMMITTCAGQFKFMLNKIYLGSNYNADDFQELDSNIEFMDMMIQELKEEIEVKK
jgi:hypothetical protein